MGHKFYIGAALLFVLLFLCLWIGQGVELAKAEVSALVEQATAQAEEGQMPLSSDSISHAAEIWEQHHGMLASFSDHSSMEVVDRQLAKTGIFAKQQNKEEFLACCAELQDMLRSLSQEHKFTWWNLLSVVFSPVHTS